MSERALRMRYQAVVFDFDYTLGDATDAIFAGFTHGFTTMGYPAPERETVRRTVGMELEKAFALLTGNESPEAGTRFHELFAEVARPMQRQGVPLCAGAKDLLFALGDGGVLTAVVSTKNTATLSGILTHHGLDQVLSLIVGGDMVSRSKPDPEGLNMAMDKLGLKKEEVLYCGDTVIDAKTAQGAGTDFCAVLNGTTPAKDFDLYPYRHIAEDLIDLRHWLGM
ncbi:MAG: HAD family hydrolase [Clostridia bacterium]|nr:HAD family hydrolase [Clostridia bacterium]